MIEPIKMTELFVSGAVGVLIGAGIVFLILKAKASGLAARSEELVRAREEATAEMAVLRETNSSLRADLAAERAAREQEIKGWAEKQEAHIQAQEELMKQFDALSRKALDSNSKSFMELAKTQIEKMVQDVDTKEEKRKLELEKLVSHRCPRP